MTLRRTYLIAIVALIAAAMILAARQDTVPSSSSPQLSPSSPVQPATAASPAPASGQPATPGSTFGTAPAEQQLVVRFVTEFAIRFARPTTAEQVATWRSDIAAYLDTETAAAVSQLSPSLIPYTEVTGPPQLLSSQMPYRANVPTDNGVLTLTVCPDDELDLIVCGIDLGGRA